MLKEIAVFSKCHIAIWRRYDALSANKMTVTEMVFHIHANIIHVAPEGEVLLVKRGFRVKPFLSSLPFQSQYVPLRHLSWKGDDVNEFRAVFGASVNALSSICFIGYLEGEYVAREESIDKAGGREGNRMINGPTFSLKLFPARCWRQSEVHITLSSERTSPYLHSIFADIGFFCSQNIKDGEIYNVYTAQGKRDHVGKIYSEALKLINTAGVPAYGKIKEERSLSHWISDGYTWFMPHSEIE